MKRRFLLVGALMFAFAVPSVALAEEEGGAREELQAKIKKKMEEIRRLMEENEKALLELSTGGKDKPRRVDVEVPDAPGGSAKGSDKSGGGSAGSGAKSGEDIARRLRELIEGSRSQGGRIPAEIETLLKMIPKSQGKGQGKPQDGKPSFGDKKEQQSEGLRDDRKQLDEQNQQQGDKKPEGGDKSKSAQRDKMKTGRPEGADKKSDATRDDNVPAWAAALPPEIRDALAGGQAEKIPARYRHLIARYNLWLQKQASKGGR